MQSGRVRVRVDGQPYCSVPRGTGRGRGLKAGVALDAAGVRDLNRVADEEAAFRTVLRALERRSFAVAELGRWLVRKGHPGAASRRL